MENQTNISKTKKHFSVITVVNLILGCLLVIDYPLIVLAAKIGDNKNELFLIITLLVLLILNLGILSMYIVKFVYNCKGYQFGKAFDLKKSKIINIVNLSIFAVGGAIYNISTLILFTEGGGGVSSYTLLVGMVILLLAGIESIVMDSIIIAKDKKGV